jgi:regulatory protein
MHDDQAGGGDGAERRSAGKRNRGREQSPTQRALGLLVRREHSRKELTRKLTSRGLDATEVSAAVDRLAGEGWQDDARFAESLVRSRASSGYGPVRIRAELGTHGLDREAIARAMDSHEDDWPRIARELAQRRFGDAIAEDPTVRRKAADSLLRRGFDSASIRGAIRFDPDD